MIRIKALVINILATRTPLYLVCRFYLYQELANLFGKGVLLQALNLNDADSALIPRENLKKMHDKNLFFISRLPATFELEKKLIDLAWQKDDWTFIDKISN